jgi:hypothetical protein
VLRFDHVVRAVPNLDHAASDFLDRYGLASVPGGRHPGWGTANRLIPLGSDYLELISVVDPAEAERTAFGRTMRERIAGGEHWFASCLADDDLDGTAARLGLEITSRSRVQPDGSELRWRSAGLADERREPSFTFFIEWEVPPELHPSRSPAAHRVPATGIAWIEVAGDAARLRDWLGEVDVPFRVVDGEPGIRAVGLTTAAGELTIE